MGAVEEPVERRGHLAGGAEGLVPLVEAEVGGDDDGSVAVAPGDELEENARVVVLALARAVAQLVDDQEVRLAQLVEDVLKRVVGERGVEAAEEREGAHEAHAVVGLAGAHPEADGEMGLADGGRTDKQDTLAAVEEAELTQGHDALAAERRLFGEVVVFEAEDLREVGLSEALFDGGFLARQHLGFDDAQQKGLGAELEGSCLLEVLVKVLCRVAQVQAAQVLQ